MPFKQNMKAGWMWSLTRDGHIYLIRPTYGDVQKEKRILSSGSKHKWEIEKVHVVRYAKRGTHLLTIKHY